MASAFLFPLLLLLAFAAGMPATSISSSMPLFWHKKLSSSVNNAFDFKEATINDIQIAFDEGRLNSSQLVQHYLDQISSLNSHLHAILEVNPDALSDAAQADFQRVATTTTAIQRSPLHGIPVIVKDNIATKDRLNTTSGSFAILGSIVPRDAGVINLLRKTGAIILGKATRNEWDNFRSINAPDGWSPCGGQGKNPFLGTNGPCGTSSGSEIAVAANLVMVAIGTDLDSSITCPASMNSIVGIKPTVGITSRSGVVPVSQTRDTVGPMARTVADAVALLDAMSGFDEFDAEATKAAEKYTPIGGFRKFLNEDGLKGKRIGILSDQFNDFNGKSFEAAILERHFEIMRKKGATLINNLEMPNETIMFNQTESGEVTVLLAEFKASIQAYLSDLVSSPVRSLADIIAFNNQHPLEERMDEFGQKIFLASEKTNGFGEIEKEANNKMIQLSNGMEMVLKENNLDAVVFTDQVFNHALAIGGFPAISVPAGYHNYGAPFGISFFGLVGTDAELIEIAYAFEQATKVRKTPPK